MVIVAGTILVAPADRPEYLDDRAPVVIETRREPGCLDYAFSADVNDPGIVRVFERWESLAALGAHVEIVNARAISSPPPVAVLQRKLTRYEVADD